MLVVRRFEEQLILLYEAGELPGHYHLSVGQEGTALGVLAHAGPDDVVYTTHRNHGHLLIRGARPEPLFAEILGRSTGYSRGRAGTLHLSAPDLGLPWSSALVGGNVPQAVGAAFALSRLRPGAIAVCFFGDGAFEEGAVFEALNTSAVLRLPVLFVCENNGLAEDHGVAGAFPTSSTAAERLTDLSGAFQIPSVGIDGIDAQVVSETVARLADEVRSGGGPRFVEAGTVRWPGSRPLWPELTGGRFQTEWLTGEADPPAEIAGWTSGGDPLRPLYERLVAAGELSRDELHAIDADVRAEIEAAATRAVEAPMPAPESAFDVPAGVG
jgi:acetoin:2,6-dichlorophenolindophenol oxidoreductase subunit alpha